MTSSTVKTISKTENNIANKSFYNPVDSGVLSELELQDLPIQTDDKSLNSEKIGRRSFDDLLKLIANKLNLSSVVNMK